MNPKEIMESVSALSRDQVFTLLNLIEQNHDMKIMCVTRVDMEDAINPNIFRDGSGSWNMTDDQWQKFRTTYLWRKGIEEQMDYQFIYDWARDEWNDLGFAVPGETAEGNGFTHDGDKWTHCDRPAWYDDDGVTCSKCQQSFSWDEEEDEVTA